MNDVLLDPIFNLQTVPPLKPDKWLDDTSTILTQVSIETARPIVLTQDPAKLLNPERNYVYLPATASISIHADEVTVCGKLSFPGRNVVIVTRVLGAEDDGSNPAIISVDGAPLAEEKAHPAFLLKGVPPKGKPEKAGKVPVGRPDWSPSNHPNEMNGEDGDEGKPGNAAGNVWICCQKTSFHGTEHKLSIAAEGGPGGDGQRGQDGADGAPGTDGRSTEETHGPPRPGTNGGDAGNGAKGGKAGQGGHGGSIQFHCIASQSALAINCQGGNPGTPGEGSKRGQKGRRGEGGKGGISAAPGGVGTGVSWVQHDDAPPGKEGQDGRDGDPGGKADSSNPGSSRITWGEVDYTDLVQMASITQLQMLFERTRADYLLTEPPNYSLRLMAVAPLKDSSSSAPDLVNEGTNLVVVGSSRDGLHVRIFDGSGQKVVDKQEPEMIKAQGRLQISMADVLVAGNWVTPEGLDRMSKEEQQALMSSAGQRQALIGQLSRISGLPKDAFKELNDYDLTGWGGVASILLQMGIRDEIGLKINLEAYHNAVISAVVSEIARNTGYDEASLRKLNDQELVRVALDPDLLSPAPRNKFALRGGMGFLRPALFSQIPPITLSDVLQAGGWITAHELSWMQYPDHRKTLINQLRWKTGLVNEFHNKMYDRDLIDFGAAMAFLLQMGIRDEASFKGDRECGRSTLIGEVAGKCGYDRKYLEGLNNEELVRLALDPKPTNQFALRGGMVFLRRQLYRTISLGEVLQAGNWLTPAELDKVSRAELSTQAQRQILINQLSRISDLEKDIFGKLNDDDLTGLGAVMAFLLQMGIRDEVGLKANLEDYRNTLILAVAGNCGYEVGYLQGRRNLELVQLALEPKEQNKFVIRGGMLLLQKRLLGTEKVAALKKLFEMSLSDVLRAGGWVAPDPLKAMSVQDQRQALIDQLSRISGLPKAEFEKLNDYDLIGRGAVTVFLLQMGIREEAGLKVQLDYRNTLIMEVAGSCGYDVGYLQGLDNQQVVRLALEPKRTNHFVLRGNLLDLRDRFCNASKIPLRKQEGIIALAADIANYTDTWSSIGQRLEWLFHLLKAASKDYPGEPKKEHPEKALAKTIQPSVWSATNNHIDGLDYYGHTPDWVPILSLGEYLDAFKNSVNRLEGIETTHKDYFAAWNNQTAATKHLKTVLGSVDDYKDFLSDRIKAVKEDKDRTEKSINTKDTERQGLEDSLNTRLKNFEEKVEAAFGLTWETFLNCLSQLGFANFSEPARALKTLSKQGGFLKADLVEGGAVVGGFASAGAMVAGPVGMMLNEGVNNILNDYGERVNKKWLLQQIDVISGELDLRSELQDRSDGFKSYTASQRVLVELSKFEELCKQFRKSVPEEAQLRKDLDAYIENITTRNRYIDYYNSLVQDLLDLLGDRKKLETRKSVVEGQLALTSNPGLPAMATFVSALFERAKAECLHDFYLAKRAYSFWALEPYGKFFDSIQNPEAITSKSLRLDHGTLTSQILKRLEDGFGSVSFFPRRDKSEASLGVIVVLSKESHPDFFQDLQDENKADFELEPATYASTKPSKAYAPTKVAWSGTRPELDPSTPHPFHGKTNVRLTKARPWIVGLYTESGTTTVKLTHLGEERFCSSENEPYPPCTDNQESEYVSHRPKDIDFAYSAAGLSWSPVADIFTPGQLTQDGDLGFPQPGAGLKDKHESIYAPIGPFGKWTLTVRPEDNTEDPKNKPLNWDSVEAIVIDFHVFAEGFSSEMVRSARAAAGRR